MSDLLALLLGIGLAAAGGQYFVEGIVGVAARLRVPAALVAATGAAFGTSAPELSVAVAAAFEGTPQISLGDALGSNIVNTSLVLGLLALVLPLPASSRAASREYAVALAAPALTAVLLADGALSRWDGLLLLSAFVAWLAVVVREAAGRRSPPGAAPHAGTLRMALVTAGGLAALVAAGELIVTGSQGAARELGVSGYAVGATLVALGTSVPELATAVVARWRQLGDVATGTLLGSNVFNGLCIVALPALVHPYAVPPGPIMLTLAAGAASVLLLALNTRGVGRATGAAAVLIHVAHAVLVPGVS